LLLFPNHLLSFFVVAIVIPVFILVWRKFCEPTRATLPCVVGHFPFPRFLVKLVFAIVVAGCGALS